MKAIGLLGIIIAHVNAPKWMMLLRSFDVPLMVILSGYLAGKSRIESYSRYVIKRFQRLVVPTWVFLTVFFLFTYKDFTWSKIIKSYLFQQDSIGYVWIILVYLLCALAAPFLKRFASRRMIIYLGVLYVLYEICCHVRFGMSNRLIYYTFYYYPYLVLTYYGIRISALTKTQMSSIALGSGVVFLVLAVYYAWRTGHFQLVSIAKYPPRLYYLCYALMTSSLLVMFAREKELRIFKVGPVRFLSSHSLWIYLWHIVFLRVTDSTMFLTSWVLRLVAVLALSCFAVYLQSLVVSALRKTSSSTWLKVFEG